MGWSYSHRGINQKVRAQCEGWGVGIVMGGSTKKSEHSVRGAWSYSHRGINQKVRAQCEGWGVGMVKGGSTRMSEHSVRGGVVV